MSNDSAGVHEVRAAANSSRRPEAEADGDQVEPSDITDAEVIDPDVVVIDEVPPNSASGARDRDPAGPSPSAAYSGIPAGAEDDRVGDASSYPADEGATHPVSRTTYPAGAGTGDAPNGSPADPAGQPTAYPRHDLRAGGAGGRPTDAARDLPADGDADLASDADRASDADLAGDADLASDADLMHERWAAIQSTFVDDPRGSVAAAADLVAEAIGTLVASTKERERGLRGEWDRDGVDTEGLRTALRNYRGFLDRLVAR